MTEWKGPVLKRVYQSLYDSETGESVPSTGKCLDCQASTDEGKYHCPACIAKYVEKNKPTPEQLKQIQEMENRRVQRAILWMYNAGESKTRSYTHTCLDIPGDFRIGFETMTVLEKRGLIEWTKYRGVMVLTKKGEEEAGKLYRGGKSWKFV